jgi:hypothetical protein
MKTKLFLPLTALLALANVAAAQGTGFTYQGRLQDGSHPANGSYDLRFALHDAASGGAPVGGALTNAATAVSNGLFTVTLDFGAGVFNGNARWLEIGVRPNGATPFATLEPRQALTAAPYAVFAGGVNAANINGPITSNNLASSIGLWTKSGSEVYYTGGYVGVGTNNPSSPLEVNGLVTASRYSAAIGTAGTVGYGFQGDPNTGLFSVANNELALATQGYESLRVNSVGRVGVGTTNPLYALTVADPNHQLALVDTDNTNKTWTLTTIQNNGFGIYENGATARLVVESGGRVTASALAVSGNVTAGALAVSGNATVDNGKAVVYNYNATEKMMQVRSTGWSVNLIGANASIEGGLSWGNLGFTAPPAVFVGSFEAGASGLQTYHQFIVTAHSATTTGCTLRFFNAGSASASLNGNVNLLIIGSR